VLLFVQLLRITSIGKSLWNSMSEFVRKKFMSPEAVPFAAAFDRLGHQVLSLLDAVPESALYWPPPLPQSDSLFARALSLVEESEYWVLMVVGSQSLAGDHLSASYPVQNLTDLKIRYYRWLRAIHRVLDELPAGALDQFIALRVADGPMAGHGPATIRDCLLQVLCSSVWQAGRIEFLCQLFAHGERVLHEVAEQHQRALWE
jgi:hypothetical protein